MLPLMALTVALGLIAARSGRVRFVLPLVPLYCRLLVRIGWLRAPEGPLEWGALALVLGFGALGASMIIQLRTRPTDA